MYTSFASCFSSLSSYHGVQACQSLHDHTIGHRCLLVSYSLSHDYNLLGSCTTTSRYRSFGDSAVEAIHKPGATWLRLLYQGRTMTTIPSTMLLSANSSQASRRARLTTNALFKHRFIDGMASSASFAKRPAKTSLESRGTC